ncbi:hypothetical protein G7K_0050-t1 [Saitoella complicata NRRL Y-17804]|uniref:Uncharacterized protein n=2 Tax=Saitoella complicata (strain BCRC 22490 / CBS 7301 / JCM 7358 / NBRC 10748 / NRRL Y-17804) TaxID=698492 RepID=A0A0E9N7I9_SAICN|nr:hypothetical protein G7K_0050-t1 [Saitoella complicata NRRL Y-17804]
MTKAVTRVKAPRMIQAARMSPNQSTSLVKRNAPTPQPKGSAKKPAMVQPNKSRNNVVEKLLDQKETAASLCRMKQEAYIASLEREKEKYRSRRAATEAETKGKILSLRIEKELEFRMKQLQMYSELKLHEQGITLADYMNSLGLSTMAAKTKVLPMQNSMEAIDDNDYLEISSAYKSLESPSIRHG